MIKINKKKIFIKILIKDFFKEIYINKRLLFQILKIIYLLKLYLIFSYIYFYILSSDSIYEIIKLIFFF